jgi:uncharacterized protein (TIRG00374 family)
MAVSIFSAATLIGSVSMLPGGLVSTESSMLLLLTQVGLGTVTALASVLIIRVCSLWLAIGIGVAALIYLKRHRAVMPEQLAPEWESRFLGGIMRTDANQEPVASP